MSTGRKLTHSWITTASSFFLSFATINSCVLYTLPSWLYERRWICLTFLFPSRQTLDRVRGRKPKKKNCWILRDIEKHAVALDLSRMSPNTPVFMYIYDWTSYVHIYNTYERETTVRETLSPPTVHQSFPEFEMSILICFFVYRIHCFWFLMRFCVFFLFLILRDEIQ